MIQIGRGIALGEHEIELTAVRAQGPGGQNVNKVSSAIVLRFDIGASSLPARYKDGLLALHDRRISQDGVLLLKAQRFRTQERNREDALTRFIELVLAAGQREKPRIATKPTKSSQRQRVDDKKRRAGVKSLRRAPEGDG